MPFRFDHKTQRPYRKRDELPYLIVVLLCLCVIVGAVTCTSCKGKEKKDPRIDIYYLDSTQVVWDTIEVKQPDKLDSLLLYIKYYAAYHSAEFSQDSCQIQILRRQRPSEKLIRLYYYYDSIRVYYAKLAPRYLKR